MSLYPDALRLPLKLLPNALQTRIAARVLNHLLRGQPIGARLAELEGCSIGLAIRDAGARLHFRIEHGRLVPAGTQPSAVVIYGDLNDFADLALRAEDADTLFFHRRLAIEGDTETGLHVKNVLDTLEYDWGSHFRTVLPPPFARIASSVVHRLRALAAR